MIAAIALCSVTAHASSWMYLNGAYTDKMLGYFDADTVVKKGDTVTIWAKFVKEENSPDKDGSYSTAQRLVYSCKKRTEQTLTSTIYDKSHQFMSTYPNPGKETDIIPDSLGETILKELCKVDFPKGATPVINNDIYTTTTNYFDYVKAQKNDPAPFAANWFLLNAAGSDSSIYFFDPGTVVKNGDTITIWVKYVKEENSPDTDGSYSAAMKEDYVCNKNTMQILLYSTYNKSQQFIFTNTKPGPIGDIKPGSIGGEMIKAICSSDFPQNKQSDLYGPVEGGDIYAYAKKYFDYLKAKKTDPAPM